MPTLKNFISFANNLFLAKHLNIISDSDSGDHCHGHDLITIWPKLDRSQYPFCFWIRKPNSQAGSAKCCPYPWESHLKNVKLWNGSKPHQKRWTILRPLWLAVSVSIINHQFPLLLLPACLPPTSAQLQKCKTTQI